MNDRHPFMGKQNSAYRSLWFLNTCRGFLNTCRGFLITARGLLFCSLLLFAAEAWAGYIALEAKPTAVVNQVGENQVLTGNIIITNTGNEVAGNVSPEIVIGKLVWRGDGRKIPANGSETWIFSAEAQAPPIKKGAYPLILKNSYQDLNGFKFSNVQLFKQEQGGPDRSQLIPLGIKLQHETKGTNRFIVSSQIFNRSSQQVETEVKIFLPEELKASGTLRQSKVEPGNFILEDFLLENTTGLPGSSYAVHVTAEWETNDAHWFSSETINLKIEPPKPGPSWLFAGVIGSAITLVALVLIQLRLFRRKSDTNL